MKLAIKQKAETQKAKQNKFQSEKGFSEKGCYWINRKELNYCKQWKKQKHSRHLIYSSTTHLLI